MKSDGSAGAPHVHGPIVVSLVIIVSGFVFSWVVGRFHSTAGAVISLIAGLVARIAVVGAMTYSTLQAVDRGGWFVALAALFVLIGLSAIFMSAVTAGAI